MIALENVRPSSKAAGKHELPLIALVAAYFRGQGHAVVQRASLNVAWGTILSDIDVLASDGNDLIAVEIKSRQDSLSGVDRQIIALKRYMDYVYLATERHLRRSIDSGTGLLRIDGDQVRLIREPRRINSKPTIGSLARLRRICLARIMNDRGNKLSKYGLVEQAISFRSDPNLHQCLKQVVTCSRTCATDCPIWAYDFQKSPIS